MREAHRAGAEATRPLAPTALQQIGVELVECRGFQRLEACRAEGRDDVCGEIALVRLPRPRAKGDAGRLDPLLEEGAERFPRGPDVVTVLKPAQDIGQRRRGFSFREKPGVPFLPAPAFGVGAEVDHDAPGLTPLSDVSAHCHLPPVSRCIPSPQDSGRTQSLRLQRCGPGLLWTRPDLHAVCTHGPA